MKKYVRDYLVEKYLNEEMDPRIPDLLSEATRHGLLHEVLDYAGNIIMNTPRKDNKINLAIIEAFDEWIK